ncbi:NAD-dependent epimerase/dehydratase family protein [Dietzia cercidiphylli]|uniref:NAD-dependent epimerase/dehydratase family protein n=1 Tax=Dietzia cercidiphylli TaxID=498199 RepID=UPI0035CD3862
MNSEETGKAATVAVVGASGFIGTAVASALEESGAHVLRVKSPRLKPQGALRDGTSYYHAVVTRLSSQFKGCSAVVNAAGVAEPTRHRAGDMTSANAILPGLVAAAASAAGARTVHISSAAVQGRIATLDSSSYVDPISKYAKSKSDGEKAALDNGRNVIIYRPPGVHGPNRNVTRAVKRLATGRISCVAAPGSNNTPQAHIANVASAIAFLATTDEAAPNCVSHPSEGLTTAQLLSILGGRSPVLVPRALARCAVAFCFAIANLIPAAVPHARRLEVLWFGQGQALSWLSDAGWRPPVGIDGWNALRESPYN